MLSLSNYLKEVTDNRRLQGTRYPLVSFLSIIIIGYLGGHYSGKSLSRYFKNNEKDLVDLFGFHHGVPGSTRINTFIKSLDFNQLNEVFFKWITQVQNANEWVSIDGKALRHTVTNCQDSKQNFLTMVGAFAQQSGLLIKYNTHENGKGGEPQTARELIKQLEGKGYILTLDAVHCKKKPSKLSWSQEMALSFS